MTLTVKTLLDLAMANPVNAEITARLRALRLRLRALLLLHALRLRTLCG